MYLNHDDELIDQFMFSCVSATEAVDGCTSKIHIRLRDKVRRCQQPCYQLSLTCIAYIHARVACALSGTAPTCCSTSGFWARGYTTNQAAVRVCDMQRCALQLQCNSICTLPMSWIRRFGCAFCGSQAHSKSARHNCQRVQLEPAKRQQQDATFYTMATTRYSLSP